MTTNPVSEAALEEAIRAWARTLGVDEPIPINVAREKAMAAYHRGASLSTAAGLARGFILCWMRHPANLRLHRYPAAS